MEKETVIKQFWKIRKRLIFQDVLSIIFWVLVLWVLYSATLLYPSAMEPMEWVSVWILALILAYWFGGVCALNPLIKDHRTLKKIKAGEYSIVEDTVVDKSIHKGPFFSKLYSVKFEKYAPEGIRGILKNSALLPKKAYHKIQIGDVMHYLVLNDSFGRLSFFVNPEEQEKGMTVEGKKIYVRDLPKSWKYFFPPYNCMVFLFLSFLTCGVYLFLMRFFDEPISIVSSLLFLIVLLWIHTEKMTKLPTQICEQFMKEENISREEYNVSVKFQKKQVTFFVEPKKRENK